LIDPPCLHSVLFIKNNLTSLLSVYHSKTAYHTLISWIFSEKRAGNLPRSLPAPKKYDKLIFRKKLNGFSYPCENPQVNLYASYHGRRDSKWIRQKTTRIHWDIKVSPGFCEPLQCQASSQCSLAHFTILWTRFLSAKAWDTLEMQPPMSLIRLRRFPLRSHC